MSKTKLFWKDEDMEAVYTCAELAGVEVYELTDILGDELDPHQKLQIIDNARQMVKGHGELERREFQRVCNLIYRVGIASLAYDKLNEEDCNFGIEEDRYDGLDSCVRVLMDELSAYVNDLRFNGDPRGCSINMRLTNGEWNTWGREFAASWYRFDPYNWTRLYHSEVVLAGLIAEELHGTGFPPIGRISMKETVKELLASLHEYRFLFPHLTEIEGIGSLAMDEIKYCIISTCDHFHPTSEVNNLINNITFGRDADTHNCWITAELAYGDWGKTVTLD